MSVLGLSPIAEMTLWSLLLSLLSVLLYRFLGAKPERLREIKGKQKEMKGRMDAAKKAGKTEEMNKLMKESLELQNQQMKGNFKPMLASLVVFLLPLWVFFPQYYPYPLFKVLLPFSVPLLGPDVSWLGWYILIAVPGNFLFRRLLGMDFS